MRARVQIFAVAAAVTIGVALPASPAGADEARSSAAPAARSWVLLAADHLSAVVLDVLDEALVAEPAAAPAPPPPPPVTDPASWVWPADGPITSPFGPRWGRQHAGVDIDAPTGSAVIAPQAGTVTLAGWNNAYGNSVIIDHGHGITTLNAHLSAVHVTVGQVVAQGHHLGAVGATGAVTGSHLHYEVHVSGAAQNPVPWLQGPRTMAAPPAAPAAPAAPAPPAPAPAPAPVPPAARPTFA